MKVAVLRKRSVFAAAFVALALITAACLTTPTTAAVFLGKSPRQLPIYGVAREEKQVAISFDAAWGADKTQQIIDICNRHEVTATFFLVGFWVDKYPEMVKTIDDNGFEIGNHSENHLKMSTIGEAEIEKELSSVNEKITAITGKEVKVFRPPFGDYNDRLINKVNAMGMYPVQWSVDSLDWKGLSGMQITERVMKGVKPGGIVLFHNNSDYILDALPVLIPKLKNEGYTFVKMSDQIYKEGYTIDNNGIQHKNA